MKKVVYIIPVLLALLSCSQAEKKEYSGYIYNKKEPIRNAKIVDVDNRAHFSYTDSKGYFVLKKLKESPDEIIIIQKNSEIDTINLLSGGGLKKAYIFFFREGFSDTLYLDRERFFKNQTKGK
ncbi:hypothetical protein [Flavobacterium davisii]|uniref:hypothetical protein n=1 Tax=Flavobacterium davisii TaxID=2906077 RepID=UPI0035D0FF57